MLLERSDAILNLSDPNVVLEPCKCHPTECVLENGDPLVCKRERKSHMFTVSNASADKKKLTSLMPPSTHLVHTTPPSSQTTQSTHPTDSAESSDGQASDGEVIVVNDSNEEGEVTDEDNDMELGTDPIPCMTFVIDL